MDPALLFGHLDPANNFAMGGLPMALAKELLMEGKPLPKMLFINVMVEKTQILIEHIKNHHLGLCLTANIGENIAAVKMYNFATTNTQLLHITISNLWDLRGSIMETVCRSQWNHTSVYAQHRGHASIRRYH